RRILDLGKSAKIFQEECVCARSVEYDWPICNYRSNLRLTYGAQKFRKLSGRARLRFGHVPQALYGVSDNCYSLLKAVFIEFIRTKLWQQLLLQRRDSSLVRTEIRK